MPVPVIRAHQWETRCSEGRTLNRTPVRDRPGLPGVVERPAVPTTPGNLVEGRGPGSAVNATSGRQPGDWRSLSPPEKVEVAWRALHTKAKNAPDYRSTPCTTSCHRRDVLSTPAARWPKRRDPVDGQSFAAIEAQGAERWLDELMEELRTRTHSSPVRTKIPLSRHPQAAGIPRIKDRKNQDAGRGRPGADIRGIDLEPEQYAYRLELDAALYAVRRVERHLRTGHTEVVDADLSGYFDGIPHAELMKSVSRRISDGRLLRLIKMWLETPVEETDAKGTVGRPGIRTRMGNAAGLPDLPVVKHLHATLAKGVEDGWS